MFHFCSIHTIFIGLFCSIVNVFLAQICSIFIDNVGMDFWDRLKSEIKRQNTTQEWIANQCGISFGTFRKWLSRKTMPNVDQAYLIAKTLGVSVEYLVTGNKDNQLINPQLKSIHDNLLLLTDEELKSVRVLVEGLAKPHKEKRETARKRA